MFIREAAFEDAESIAAYFLMAMDEIVYKFIGKRDYTSASVFLLRFIKTEHNQYSYQNCLVAVDDGRIIAAVNIYNGAHLTALRAPVIDYLQTQFGMESIPEPETQAGEFYIDTLAVHPEHRGRGIGTKILEYLITEYTVKQKLTLGLLVEDDNLAAKKLYLKLGFKTVGYKTLVGRHLEHLQISGNTP